MYFIPQVDRVDGGEYIVSLPGGRKVVSTYESKGPNNPVNVSIYNLIRRGEKKELLDLKGEPYMGEKYATFPTIVFELMQYEDIWYYPPSVNGRDRRDADYKFIMNNVGKQCPRDRPSAIR